MGRFYSDTLEKGIRLLYFQADPSQYPRGIKLLKQAVQAEEPDAFYFLARCYAWEDGNVPEDIKKARCLSKRGIELGSDLSVLGAEPQFNSCPDAITGAGAYRRTQNWHSCLQKT